MLQNRIAVVVVCLMGFACAPVRAEDKPQKTPAVVPIAKVFDLDEVTSTVKKLFPAKTVIVPLPDEHALLVYMTDKELAQLRDMLKKCVPEEPKPAEKTYTFHMKGAKWDDVLDWYAKETGRKADVRVKPKGTFTCLLGKDRQFTIGEITDLLNEELAKQKLVLVPHRKTFAVVSSEGKIDRKLIPVVELEEVSQFGRTAIVDATISLAFEAQDIADEVKKLLAPGGELLRVKGKSIVVRDTFGNVMRIREAVRPL